MKKFFLPTLFAVALISQASAGRGGTRKFDQIFERVDINNDQLVSATEFLGTQARGASEVLAKHRFRYADVNQDGVLDLTEFRASRAGKLGGKPNKVQQFFLADVDEDRLLDPFEYASTLNNRTPSSKLLKAFGKRDRDDSSTLTPREFGIRNYPF